MNAPITTIETPVVVQVHDIFRYKGDVSRLDKLRQRIRLPRMFSHADKIVTVSEFSKSEISEHLDISASKIEVVYNGVDPLFFGEEDSVPVEVPDEYLLYVGGTNARKNIHGLLQAFEILKSDLDVNHELIIVGPDPKRFHNYPLDNISGEDIHVTGFITQRELKFVYENADVFLFPSLYEGFGMAPLEAMACGTPVVASDQASLPEVLGSGARLVNPEEPVQFAHATIELLKDEQVREELVTEGKKVARKYTWDASAERLREILEDVYLGNSNYNSRY